MLDVGTGHRRDRARASPTRCRARTCRRSTRRRTRSRSPARTPRAPGSTFELLLQDVFEGLSRRGPVRPRRLEPAVRPAPRSSTRSSPRCATGSRARRCSTRARRRRSRARRSTSSRPAALLVLEIHERARRRRPARCWKTLGYRVRISVDLTGRDRVVEGKQAMKDSFRTQDGRKLTYRREGSGPLLVCHPGGPGLLVALPRRPRRARRDAHARAARSARHRAAPTRPRTTRAYTTSDYVADVEELREHLGVDAARPARPLARRRRRAGVRSRSIRSACAG